MPRTLDRCNVPSHLDADAVRAAAAKRDTITGVAQECRVSRETASKALRHLGLREQFEHGTAHRGDVMERAKERLGITGESQ